MSKTTLLLFITTLILTSTLEARIVSGKKQYLKDCKSCHGKGDRGAQMGTIQDWDRYFKDAASSLVNKHSHNKANKYFHSKRFKKHAPDLKSFLQEYASDSGNTPSC